MAEITEKNLPEVLIIDILTRLPVKSLLRFKCVCKTWCALIADPAFVKEHLNLSLANNSNHSLLFIYYDRYFSVDLDVCEQEAAVELVHPQDITLEVRNDAFLRKEVLGSCHGLFCISNSDADVFLWNPSIRTHQRLPNVPPIDVSTHLSYLAHGFGYDPTTDDYKLVMVAQPFDEMNDHYNSGSSDWGPNKSSDVKVYSLSTNSWRQIRDMRFLFCFGGFGVFANYALHWVSLRWAEPHNWTIVSFDLQDEEFREIPLPEFSNCEKFDLEVGVLGRQLCLLCNLLSHFEVWVMNDYGVKDSWVKQFTIDQTTNSFYSAGPLYRSKNGEVIFRKHSEPPLVLYDPASGTVRNLRIPGAPDRMETMIYVGSLIPFSAQDGIKMEIMTYVGSLIPLNAQDGIEQEGK